MASCSNCLRWQHASIRRWHTAAYWSGYVPSNWFPSKNFNRCETGSPLFVQRRYQDDQSIQART
jgi:hypothetical protein